MSEASERAGAFFGRRKGKKLRAGQDELVQSLLPAIRAVPGRDLPSQFPNQEARQTWLEIGFGGGEHLAAQARAHPDVNFLGCEPFVNGMAKLLAAIEHERLDNVRVWDDDVTELLPTLPDASFDRVYILYPDPWPKRRQRKRRLVSDEMLETLARVMKPGSRAALRQRHRRLYRLGARPSPALPAFPLESLSRRRLAPALRGLAGHPLRGQGDPRRPRAELPDLRPDLIPKASDPKVDCTFGIHPMLLFFVAMLGAEKWTRFSAPNDAPEGLWAVLFVGPLLFLP